MNHSKQQGYQIPTDQYPDQPNQQSGEEIHEGATQENQLEELHENIPEGGRESYPEKQAGTPPLSDEDLDNGEE